MAKRAVLLEKEALLALRCTLCSAVPTDSSRCLGVDPVGRKIGRAGSCVFAVVFEDIKPHE